MSLKIRRSDWFIGFLAEFSGIAKEAPSYSSRRDDLKVAVDQKSTVVRVPREASRRDA